MIDLLDSLFIMFTEAQCLWAWGIVVGIWTIAWILEHYLKQIADAIKGRDE